MTSRIARTFAELKKQDRAAFIPFVMAGDPDEAHSLEILRQLPSAGADLIEIGMAFSDPMADGPAVQASARRALESGQTLRKTLNVVRAFRETNQTVPLILMGYFNPVFCYGAQAFVKDAAEAGVDGLIIVDCPPETDDELAGPARKEGLDFIRLVTPTTDEVRLQKLLKGASGFLYLVSIAGVTGMAAAKAEDVAAMLAKIRQHSDLPLAVGFGVKTPEQAKELAKKAEAIVIASVLLDFLGQNPGETGFFRQNMANYLSFAEELAKTIHEARRWKITA